MVRSTSESPARAGSVNVFAVTLADRSRNSLEGSTPGRSPLQPAKVRSRSLRWPSSWLPRVGKLAGMDGNRTHPGRLSSAPQTVLKTAGLPSTDVRQGAHTFSYARSQSVIVRDGPQPSAGLAVILAVVDRSDGPA